MRKLWMALVLFIACAGVSRPGKLTLAECRQREDCRVVVVHNPDQFDMDIRVNERKYLTVNGYSSASFTINTSQLFHGDCAVVTARSILAGVLLTSDETCIHSDQYFDVVISYTHRYIWLTPYNNR